MRDASGSAQGTARGCQGMGIRSYCCLGDAVAQPGSLKEGHEAQLRNSVPTRAPLRGRAIDSPERSEHRWAPSNGPSAFHSALSRLRRIIPGRQEPLLEQVQVGTISKEPVPPLTSGLLEDSFSFLFRAEF